MGARENITDAVRRLMAEQGITTTELAGQLGRTTKYMARKINEGRWMVDDLVVLADLFDLEPGDFFHGYQYICIKRAVRRTESTRPGWSACVHKEKEKTKNG